LNSDVRANAKCDNLQLKICRTDDIFASDPGRISYEGCCRKLDIIREFLRKDLSTLRPDPKYCYFNANDQPQVRIPRQAQNYIRKWLGQRISSLELAYQKLIVEGKTNMQIGFVLKYSPNKNLHLVDIAGQMTWVSLTTAYFSEIYTESSNWQCDFIQAHDLINHERTICPYKLISCPLSCGLLCAQSNMLVHTKEQCMKREVACRLGCSKAMVLDELIKHEETACPNRYISFK